MKSKKLFLLLVSLILAMVTPSAYAEINVSQSEVSFEATEIKDLNILLDRAKRGISDINEPTVSLGAQVKKGTSRESIKTYTTTQKIKSEKLNDGSRDRFVTTYIALVNSDGS